MHKSRRNQQPHQGSNSNIITTVMIIRRVHIVILKYVGHLRPGMRTTWRKTLLFPSSPSSGVRFIRCRLGFGLSILLNEPI